MESVSTFVTSWKCLGRAERGRRERVSEVSVLDVELEATAAKGSVAWPDNVDGSSLEPRGI